ncbi:MAG: hypothetical protein AAFY28_22270, partial [Actinomycetota bacterium]
MNTLPHRLLASVRAPVPRASANRRRAAAALVAGIVFSIAVPAIPATSAAAEHRPATAPALMI